MRILIVFPDLDQPQIYYKCHSHISTASLCPVMAITSPLDTLYNTWSKLAPVRRTGFHPNTYQVFHIDTSPKSKVCLSMFYPCAATT